MLPLYHWSGDFGMPISEIWFSRSCERCCDVSFILELEIFSDDFLFVLLRMLSVLMIHLVVIYSYTRGSLTSGFDCRSSAMLTK